MTKLLMLAGGVVAKGATEGDLCAYVVLSAGHASRLFKVTGPSAAATISELAAATTIDMKRFEREVAETLAPAVAAAGNGAAVAAPSKEWVCGLVAAHLKKVEGADF